MSNTVICTDRNNHIVCLGDKEMCDNYINQLYFLSTENVIYEEYSLDNKFSYLYEDYEVYRIIDSNNVYLTLGEIKLLGKNCSEELQRIKFISDELDHLIESKEVFDSDIIDELEYMKDFMKRLYQIRNKFNEDNVVNNLCIDGIRGVHQEHRQNKGLPIEFIK